MHRIYLLSDPRNPNKGYVGQTRFGVSRRYRQHINGARRGDDLPLHRWLRTLERARVIPALRVVRTCATQEEANVAEQELIAVCREQYRMKLYNVTDGGEGCRGEEFGKAVARARARPETQAKHSAAMKRNWSNPVQRERRIMAMAKSNQRPEVRAKRSAALRKRMADPAQRAKMLAPERVHSAASRAARSAKMATKWGDPGYKDRVSSAISATYSTPHRREEQRLRAIESNARPKVKARIAESSRQRWADPLYHARVSAAISVGHSKPPAHGTASWYDNHKCRCDLCRAAAAQRSREYRARCRALGA